MSDRLGWAVFAVVAVLLLRTFMRGFRSGIRGDGEEGPSNYSLEVVGEASYQKNIVAIAGPRGEQSAQIFVDAAVVREDANPHDSLAVRVDIGGSVVGYLSRASARRWRKTVDHQRVSCPAVIRGGWDRGNDDRGNYGVWLQPPSEYK
ncbi:HIRAN domain-containing protein [Burkholderiaceae bacterium UC74_6]